MIVAGPEIRCKRENTGGELANRTTWAGQRTQCSNTSRHLRPGSCGWHSSELGFTWVEHRLALHPLTPEGAIDLDAMTSHLVTPPLGGHDIKEKNKTGPPSPLPHHDHPVNYAVPPICDQNNNQSHGLCFRLPYLQLRTGPTVYHVPDYSPAGSRRRSLPRNPGLEHRLAKDPRTRRCTSALPLWDWAACTTTTSCQIPVHEPMPSA